MCRIFVIKPLWIANLLWKSLVLKPKGRNLFLTFFAFMITPSFDWDLISANQILQLWLLSCHYSLWWLRVQFINTTSVRIISRCTKFSLLNLSTGNVPWMKSWDSLSDRSTGRAGLKFPFYFTSYEWILCCKENGPRLVAMLVTMLAAW